MCSLVIVARLVVSSGVMGLIIHSSTSSAVCNCLGVASGVCVVYVWVYEVTRGTI